MMPCFSGGSTISGTPGGDRWARVFGGQNSWLSDPFCRFHAGCSETGSTNEFEMQTHGKHGKKFAPLKPHHEIHSRPATATTSRRRATKYVPRVSPYSLASTDSGCVEIGVVQLSQSMTIVTHTQTQRQTGRQITIYNGTLYAPR